MNKCPDCGGTGRIMLLNSTVPCKRCMVGRAIEFDPATRTALVEFDREMKQVATGDPCMVRIGGAFDTPEVEEHVRRIRDMTRGERIAEELMPDCADDRLTIGSGGTGSTVLLRGENDGEWARKRFRYFIAAAIDKAIAECTKS